MPVTVPRCPGATLLAIRPFVAGLLHPCGTPPIAAPTQSQNRPWETASAAMPAALKPSDTTTARPGPIRSVRRPSDGDASAPTPVFTAPRTPNCVRLIPTVSINGAARTENR